jgi:hypothetical protein
VTITNRLVSPLLPSLCKNDAVDDRSGLPVANPDVSKFLTIDQIFTKIKIAFESGAQQVKVTYDASGLYPVRVFTDQVIPMADDESLIEVSDFIGL